MLGAEHNKVNHNAAISSQGLDSSAIGRWRDALVMQNVGSYGTAKGRAAIPASIEPGAILGEVERVLLRRQTPGATLSWTISRQVEALQAVEKIGQACLKQTEPSSTSEADQILTRAITLLIDVFLDGHTPNLVRAEALRLVRNLYNAGFADQLPEKLLEVKLRQVATAIETSRSVPAPGVHKVKSEQNVGLDIFLWDPIARGLALKLLTILLCGAKGAGKEVVIKLLLSSLKSKSVEERQAAAESSIEFVQRFPDSADVLVSHVEGLLSGPIIPSLADEIWCFKLLRQAVKGMSLPRTENLAIPSRAMHQCRQAVGRVDLPVQLELVETVAVIAQCSHPHANEALAFMIHVLRGSPYLDVKIQALVATGILADVRRNVPTSVMELLKQSSGQIVEIVQLFTQQTYWKPLLSSSLRLIGRLLTLQASQPLQPDGKLCSWTQSQAFQSFLCSIVQPASRHRNVHIAVEAVSLLASYSRLSLRLQRSSSLLKGEEKPVLWIMQVLQEVVTLKDGRYAKEGYLPFLNALCRSVSTLAGESRVRKEEQSTLFVLSVQLLEKTVVLWHMEQVALMVKRLAFYLDQQDLVGKEDGIKQILFSLLSQHGVSSNPRCSVPIYSVLFRLQAHRRAVLERELIHRGLPSPSAGEVNWTIYLTALSAMEEGYHSLATVLLGRLSRLPLHRCYRLWISALYHLSLGERAACSLDVSSSLEVENHIGSTDPLTNYQASLNHILTSETTANPFDFQKSWLQLRILLDQVLATLFHALRAALVTEQLLHKAKVKSLRQQLREGERALGTLCQLCFLPRAKKTLGVLLGLYDVFYLCSSAVNVYCCLAEPGTDNPDPRRTQEDNVRQDIASSPGDIRSYLLDIEDDARTGRTPGRGCLSSLLELLEAVRAAPQRVPKGFFSLSSSFLPNIPFSIKLYSSPSVSSQLQLSKTVTVSDSAQLGHHLLLQVTGQYPDLPPYVQERVRAIAVRVSISSEGIVL